MKTTLLVLTGVACLMTSGIAMVFADKATTSPGPETIRAQGGAMTDMDTVGVDSYEGGGEGGDTFKRLDINQDGFLNAQELNAYGAARAGNPKESAGKAAEGVDGSGENGARLVEQFDRNGDDVVTPNEFQGGESR